MDGNAKNKLLQKAKNSKSDEFYTQLCDIESELQHYKNHFKDKVVFCNCDDVRSSNFFKYFVNNFNELGLKKLITACYQEQNNGFFFEYTGKPSETTTPTSNDVIYFKGDGDFRSLESIELLKQSDIVVTNPPFSLFREYVSQLIEYDKKFLIIGNVNAITYKEIFKLIKEGKVWLGASIHSGDREFGVPDYYPLTAAGYRIDEGGKKFVRVKGIRWFTNMDYDERHEDLILYKKFNPQEYPKYDNYDGINVDKTKYIPKDYDGLMGVPITFLDKFNPDQFEIIKFRKGDDGKDLSVNGKYTYCRILIKNKKL
jgi:Adenine-specific methyltransferase EcoRI